MLVQLLLATARAALPDRARTGDQPVVVLEHRDLARLLGRAVDRLDLVGEDVLAAGEDDQLLAAADDVEIAGVVEVAEIAGAKEAVRGERLAVASGLSQ